MNSNTQMQWHVVYTCPNNEKKVHNELHRHNIISFLPMVNVVRQRSDRQKKLQVPLFRSYLFVKIPQGQRYRVLNFSGVVNFVTYNGAPAILKEHEIDTINKFLANDVNICTEEPTPLGVGEKVRVVVGPLNGIEGVVLQKKGDKRLFVELKTIHQTVSVDIPLNYLQKV